MKDKILVFIIGLLVGAIITATGFLIYEKTNKNSNTNQMPNEGQMKMMEKPDGEPPEKPSGSENDSNRQEPPEKPNESENNNNKTESSSKSNSKKSKTNSTNEGE